MVSRSPIIFPARSILGAPLLFLHVLQYLETCKTTRSSHFQTHTPSGFKETDSYPPLDILTYRSMRCAVTTLPRSLPVPRMKRSTSAPTSDVESEFTQCLTQRIHDIPDPASDRCPAASNKTALPVRVFYQNASTVPCGIHLVRPQARSTKQYRLLLPKWATWYVLLIRTQPKRMNPNA